MTLRLLTPADRNPSGPARLCRATGPGGDVLIDATDPKAPQIVGQRCGGAWLTKGPGGYLEPASTEELRRIMRAPWIAKE